MASRGWIVAASVGAVLGLAAAIAAGSSSRLYWALVLVLGLMATLVTLFTGFVKIET